MSTISPIQAFTLGADSVYLSQRQPPTAPDGQYDWQVSQQDGASKNGHSAVTSLITEIQTLKQKGVFVPNPKTVDAFIDLAENPTGVDDRKQAFESGLAIMSRLPQGSQTQTDLSNAAIAMLYNAIPHPTATFLGPEYNFRHADGGFNNILEPDLGRAGTRYARSVQPERVMPAHTLPDPGLIFDTLLKRRGFVASQGGHSSFTFAMASLVTHSLFRSNPLDWSINDTSSYLDLSPLYGHNEAAVASVRNSSLGRGLLYPDTFAEERLIFLPPCASAILVILSRNHNYTAEMLLKINEKGLWSDPPPEDEQKRAKQDEEIFQTARLINCGQFMSLIMGDYVAGFLGVSEGNAFGLDAFSPITLKDKSVVNRGQGNHCSVEFNLLYRWHTTVSEADEKWTADLFDRAFPGKKAEDITLQDFGAVAAKVFQPPKPPKDREFGGLTRGPDGKFDDDKLADVLMSATEKAAGQWRAHGTPACLKIVEVMGIEQSRKWGVCTMNEFRKFMGLKQFESFEEWNPDPQVAGPARRLYGHINNLELYTGLQCESTIPLSQGLWLPCGYTMMKAVLSDAIALVRGDRFYTTSFTPVNLTSWGYWDCKRDVNNGGLGGNFPKLLSRHLPRHYHFNSTYTCFPFFTPTKMKASLTRQGIADSYTFERPVANPVPKVLNTFTAIKTVFNDPLRFNVPYGGKGPDGGKSVLDCDEKTRHDADKALMLHAVFPTAKSLDEYAKWYGQGCAQLIQERTWKYDGVTGNYFDVVNDVINVMAVRWAAERLCGIDIKSKSNPRGLYTEKELFAMYAALHTLSVESVDEPEHEFSLRTTAKEAAGVIAALTAKSVLEVSPQTAPNGVIRAWNQITGFVWPPTNKPCHDFQSKITDTGRPLEDVVTLIIGLCVASAVNHGHTAVHVIDFYLDDERAKERAEIIQLCQRGDSASEELLQGYVREAMRLNPQYAGLWRYAAADLDVAQGGTQPPVSIKKGDRIWASFTNAHLNPDDFPDPLSINPTRPKTSYCLNGTGFHECPGVSYAVLTITQAVRAVFGLKGIRRAAGDAGKLKKVVAYKNETRTVHYVQADGGVSMWPGAMHLVYDS